jgi:hypothetical protein
MTALEGLIRDNTFVSDDGSVIPDGSRVIVTILEEKGAPPVSETERQRRAWAEFSELIKNDPERLPSEFDEIIARGIKFREVDFS